MDLDDEDIRRIAIEAGIGAELVDQLIGPGLYLGDDGEVRISLKIILDFSAIERREPS
jgi:hypothetical protein